MSLDIDRIGAAVLAATGSSDELTAVREALSQLATPRENDPLVFDHDEVFIRVRAYPSKTLEALKHLEPLKLAVAPVVAAVFPMKEREVMVLRYWAIPGEQRLPVDPAHPPDLATRQRFRDDLLKLVHAGWAHEWATRGKFYWRVSSKTQTIVVDDWSVLQPLDDVDDKDEVLAKIMRIA